MSSERLESFLISPERLLLQWPRGGDPLAVEVRAFAAAGGASLEAVMRLIPSATTIQLTAIGEGLAQAQARCDRYDPYSGRQIANMMTRVSRHEVLTSYQRALAEETPKAAALPSATTTLSDKSLFAPPSSAGAYFFPRATDREHLTVSDPFEPIK